MSGDQKEKTAFPEAAQELSALGYHVVPIQPGEKRPLKGLVEWPKFRDRPPTAAEADTWAKTPGIGVGIVLGSPAGAVAGVPHHVIAIDIDASDPDVVDQLVRAIPATPMAKVGEKGRTCFYRAPASIRTQAYNGPVGRLVDLLTGFDTRQTVAPPTLHPAGMAYRWLDGPVAAEDLPVFGPTDLDRLEDTLEELGWARDKREISVAPTVEKTLIEREPPNLWREVNEVALERLGAWVPALPLTALRPARGGYECVATWRESSTGRPTAARKRNLSIQTAGIKDFGANQAYTAIDLVMAAQGVSEPQATAWLRERLGMVADDSGPVIALRTTVPLSEPEPVVERPPELPDALTRVPGLVGEIVDWIVDTSMQPHRPFALAAALALVGTAAGRIYGGPTKSGTHLYILCVGPTGSGKNHAPKVVEQLLDTSVGVNRVGTSRRFVSASAMYEYLGEHPLTLSVVDEFGGFLRRMNDRHAGPHSAEMNGELRELWGSSFQTKQPVRRVLVSSKKTIQPIHAPALSILGMSTPKEFYAGITSDDVANGFLNRFLIISSLDRPMRRIPPMDSYKPPAGLLSRLNAVFDAVPPLTYVTAHTGDRAGPLITVPWDAANSPHADFLAFQIEMDEQSEEVVELYTRTAEMALRFATIRAIGVDVRSPVITMADWVWGRDLALWGAQRMATDFEAHTSASEHQARAKEVLRLIPSRGSITRNELGQKIKHKFDAKTLNSILDAMEENEEIQIVKVQTPGAGRPRLKISKRADQNKG